MSERGTGVVGRSARERADTSSKAAKASQADHVRRAGRAPWAGRGVGFGGTGRTVGQLLALGFLVAVLTLLLVGGSAFAQMRQMRADQAAVAEATEVTARIDAVLHTVLDAETGQRGYVITGRSSYLQPYEQAVWRVEQDLDALQSIQSNDPRQSAAAVAQLRTAVEAKLDELAQTIELRRSEGFEAAQTVVLTDRGAEEMDTIRQLVTASQNQQERVVAERLAISRDSVTRTKP